MSERRARRGDDDEFAKERERRRIERDERRKAREAEAGESEAQRLKQREERRRKRESGEDASSARSRREEEEKKKKEEEERKKKQQQEEEERKRREAEAQRQQEVEEEEEEEAPPDKTDGPKNAFEKIDDDRKRRIIDSLIDRLYELAEERDNKNKPAAKTATSGASTADITQLDLKVRSLRTRLRNAENATESLAKQQKDIEQKIKMNHAEVERLRKEYGAAESEYNEAIKNGAVIPEGPKRGRGAGAGKGAGFFDVVKKAQSSLWEDKFRAFKEKQREAAGSQPQWAMNLRKSDNIIGTTVMKQEKKKDEKAAWQNQPKLHKAVIDPRVKKEVEPAGAKKPAWSGVALKKAEKK